MFIYEINFLDTYAEFSTFISNNFSLQKATELFPDKYLNNDKDWTNPNQPYNHIWTKFLESEKHCCLLFNKTKSCNVYSQLLRWYEQEKGQHKSTLLHEYYEEYNMSCGLLAQLFFYVFKTNLASVQFRIYWTDKY